jgi:hypothetical protein
VFVVRAEVDGQRIRLVGETSDVRYHNQLIDLLVAMKLYDIKNDIEFPGRDERGGRPAQAPMAAPATSSASSAPR